MNCVVCEEESGDNVICEYHRKYFKELSKLDQRNVWIQWHNKVCERSRVGTYYVCYHCKRMLPRNMVCGDHFPEPKSVNIRGKFNINNGVCSCSACNCNMNGYRRRSLRKL